MAIVPIFTLKRSAKMKARDSLVTANVLLVPAIAKRVRRRLPPSFDLEDLIGVGNEALIRAAAEYDPAGHGGTPFALYARIVIRGAMLDSVRRRNYVDNTLPSIDDTPEDAVARDNVIEMEIDGGRLRRRVRAAIAQLPDAERELVTRIYMQGDKTPAQIEGRLRTFKVANRELHERALELLRGRLAA